MTGKIIVQPLFRRIHGNYFDIFSVAEYALFKKCSIDNLVIDKQNSGGLELRFRFLFFNRLLWYEAIKIRINLLAGFLKHVLVDRGIGLKNHLGGMIHSRKRKIRQFSGDCRLTFQDEIKDILQALKYISNFRKAEQRA